WTNLNGPDVSTYVKSKTLAERAAWDFVAQEGNGLELSVINPTAVFGPVLGPDYAGSIQLIQRLVEGSVPGLPNVSYGVVDARDVADLHIPAMSNTAAKGERFIASGGDPMTIPEMALVLRTRLGDAGKRVPTRRLPD